MSASEELELSDVNLVDCEMSLSPEYEIEQESDGPCANLLKSDGEDAATFVEELLADEEWTEEYKRGEKSQ